MALLLTFAPTAALVNERHLPSLTFYVRATGLAANTLTNTGIVPLRYKVCDAAGVPVGDWLSDLPLPVAAPIMRPRELMLQAGTTPFTQAYDVARPFLAGVFGADATVTDLL